MSVEEPRHYAQNDAGPVSLSGLMRKPQSACPRVVAFRSSGAAGSMRGPSALSSVYRQVLIEAVTTDALRTSQPGASSFWVIRVPRWMCGLGPGRPRASADDVVAVGEDAQFARLVAPSSVSPRPW